MSIVVFLIQQFIELVLSHPPSSLLQDINGKWRVEKVKKFSLPEEYEDSEISEVADLLERNNQTVKFFTHQHLRYLFDDNKGQYVLLRYLKLWITLYSTCFLKVKQVTGSALCKLEPLIGVYMVLGMHMIRDGVYICLFSIVPYML